MTVTFKAEVGTPTVNPLYSLPTDRLTTWNPGLNSSGGIPTTRTIYQTLSPRGGALDDTSAINTALTNCPANQIVKLNSGSYIISGSGILVAKSNVTLQGSGPGAGNISVSGTTKTPGGSGTFLVKTLGSGSAVISVGPTWNDTGAASPINLTADAVKGSYSVTLASVTGLAPGNIVAITEITDTTVSHWNSIAPADNGWFEELHRPLGQTLEIDTIVGLTVTFTTPIHITLKLLQTAHLYKVNSGVRNSGVEDLYTYGGEGGDGGGGIHIRNSSYCWVKHCESTWNSGTTVAMDHCLRCEVRDSYVHDSPAGLQQGGNSYGIGMNWYTADCLVENCISIKFNKPTVLRSSGGGNVFGYCYVDDSAADAGTYQESGLLGAHMTTPNFTLFEGCQANNFSAENTFGNSVNHVCYRNQLMGQMRDLPAVGPYFPVMVTKWAFWMSFVGNVLSSAANSVVTAYESLTASATYGCAWVIGCNFGSGETADDGGVALATILRDGNFDYVTDQVHWHGIGGTGSGNGLTPPTSSTLPDSLYLSSKPAFFGAIAWPWVDGSNAVTPLPGTLPARTRYDAGTPNA